MLIKLTKFKINFLLICIVTLFYSNSFLRKFAWADDWSFINEYKNSDIHIEHLSGLRPILQLIFDITFKHITSYTQLNMLRFFSLIGNILLVILVKHILENFEFSNLMTFLIPLLTSILPTFWIYGYWATTFIYPWVCILSLISAKVFKEKKILSGLLLIICFLTYQPAATFGILFFFLSYLKKKCNLKQLIHYSLHILICATIAFFVAKAINWKLDVIPKGRSSLIHFDEIPSKILWLITRPGILALRPYVIESRGLLAIVTFLIGFGLFLSFYKKYASMTFDFKFYGALFIIFIFAMLPIVLISENQIEFRVLPTSSVAGLIIFLLGLENFLHQFNFIIKNIVMISISSSIFIYNFMMSNQIFILDFNRDLVYLQSECSPNAYYIEVKNMSGSWPQNNYIGALSVKSDLQMSWVIEEKLEQLLLKNQQKFTDKNAKKTALKCEIDLVKYARNLK